MRLLLLVFLPLQLLFSHSGAVTYEFSGGRFGDNLLTYLHAKWISYKYGVPLFYKPFPYSSELVLDEKELHFDQVDRRHLTELSLRSTKNRVLPNFPFLYICPYFPESKWELSREKHHYFFVDWENSTFREMVRELIAPKRPLSLIIPPKDRLSVAIHIREGGGFDDEELKIKNPLKTPPISYYIECLQKLFSILEGRSLYCHIFTDALEPEKIIDQIKLAVPQSAQVLFGYREKGNQYDANVLEDFFSLLNFDILIRPESNFSIVASCINNYMIVYSPASFSVTNRTARIEEINVNFDPDAFCRLFE